MKIAGEHFLFSFLSHCSWLWMNSLSFVSISKTPRHDFENMCSSTVHSSIMFSNKLSTSSAIQSIEIERNDNDIRRQNLWFWHVLDGVERYNVNKSSISLRKKVITMFMRSRRSLTSLCVWWCQNCKINSFRTCCSTSTCVFHSITRLVWCLVLNEKNGSRKKKEEENNNC